MAHIMGVWGVFHPPKIYNYIWKVGPNNLWKVKVGPNNRVHPPPPQFYEDVRPCSQVFIATDVTYTWKLDNMLFTWRYAKTMCLKTN